MVWQRDKMVGKTFAVNGLHGHVFHFMDDVDHDALFLERRLLESLDNGSHVVFLDGIGTAIHQSEIRIVPLVDSMAGPAGEIGERGRMVAKNRLGKIEGRFLKRDPRFAAKKVGVC